MDPTANVQPNLLPHIWAVSQQKYPLQPHITLEAIADLLSRAVQVVSTVPFLWTFVDRPPDHCMFLAWLAPRQASSHLPPDGFMYMDAEMGFALEDANGRGIEVYQHRYGFVPGAENMANRVRRRYRLKSSATGESLWLVHYLRGEPVPANPSAALVQFPRRYPLPPLSSRPFMLREPFTYGPVSVGRTGTTAPGGQAGPTGPPGVSHGQTLSGATPTPAAPGAVAANATPTSTSTSIQETMHGPNAKRIKLEEEAELLPPGDEFDVPTARDISVARYVRGHEWMEEIFGSAYPASKIIRPSLGLDGLDESWLQEQIQKQQADMEEMKQRHQTRIEALRGGRILLFKQAYERLHADEDPAAVQRDVEQTLGVKIAPVRKYTPVSLGIEADPISGNVF